MNATDKIDAARLELLLSELRLPGIKLIWATLAETADKEGWPAARFLAALAEQEMVERSRRRFERHLEEARLPPGKTLDAFDFDAVPMISKAQVQALAAGDAWLEKGANLLCFGPPGGGKSHLAAALGMALIEKGWRVLFTRTTDLVQNTLTVASILYGPILARQVVSGNAALSGQTILSQLTGTTGGVGTYQLSGSATIATTANLLGNSSVGTTFAPGGYYEISMSYDPSLDNGSNGFPSFWLTDINGLYAQNLNSGYGEAANFTEWDVFEAKSGSRTPDMNGFDWTDIDGGTGASNLGTNNAVRQNYPTVTNPTSQHLYGMLWVPSTRNAGTGLIQFYLDRVHIAGSDITYTSSGGASPACSPSNPNGCLFDSESGQFVLLIDSGGGGENSYPANLTSMDVWH